MGSKYITNKSNKFQFIILALKLAKTWTGYIVVIIMQKKLSSNWEFGQMQIHLKWYNLQFLLQILILQIWLGLRVFTKKGHHKSIFKCMRVTFCSDIHNYERATSAAGKSFKPSLWPNSYGKTSITVSALQNSWNKTQTCFSFRLPLINLLVIITCNHPKWNKDNHHILVYHFRIIF